MYPYSGGYLEQDAAMMVAFELIESLHDEETRAQQSFEKKL